MAGVEARGWRPRIRRGTIKLQEGNNPNNQDVRAQKPISLSPCLSSDCSWCPLNNFAE